MKTKAARPVLAAFVASVDRGRMRIAGDARLFGLEVC
jgi:hypothetical protein